MPDYKLRIVVSGEDKASKVFKDIGSSLDDFGAKVGGIGAGMTAGITLPLAALGVAALDAGTKLNAGLANIASLGIAEERVLSFKGVIQDMAIDLGKSTQDLTDGMYQVISTFGDTADAEKILEINAKAASAGLATTTDAINMAGAVTKAYGDTSADAVQHVQDLAFTAVNLGVTTLPELAKNLGAVIPLTANMGVSMEEVFGVMATFTGVTGNTSEVVTQLRGVMQALMAPTTATTELFEAMGFASGEAALKELGLQGAMDLLVKAAEASGMPLQSFIGSIEGQTLALAASGTLQEKFTENIAAMGNVAGATDAAFEAQTNGINKLGFQYEQGKIKMEVFLQKMNDAMGPALLTVSNILTPFGDKLLVMADAFTQLDPATQTWIVGIGAAVAALGPMLVGIGFITPALGALGAALAALVSPLGLVAAGIAAAFVFDIGGIRTQFGELVTWIQSKIPAALTTLQGLWATAWAALPAALVAADAAISPVIENINAVLGQIGTFFAPIIDRLVISIGGFATEIAGMGDHFAELSAAAAPLIPMLGGLGLAISVGLGVVALTAVNLLSVVFENLGTVVKLAIDQATLILNTFTTVVSELGTGVKAVIDGDWATAWASAKTIFETFGTFATESLANFLTLISTTFTTVGTTISTTLADLGFTEAAAQVQTATDKVTAFVDWLSKIVSGDISLNLQTPQWITDLLAWQWPSLEPVAWATDLTVWAWPVLATADWVVTLMGWAWPVLSPITWVEALLTWQWPTLPAAPAWITSLFSFRWPAMPAMPDLNPFNNSTGTPSFQGGWTWVGERGPELMQLPRGTEILSNQQSMGMIGELAAGTGVNLSPNRQAGFDAFVAAQGQKEADKAAKKLDKSIDKLGKTIDKAAEKMADRLASALQGIEGLFGTSSVTADQMKMAELGVPQNFADDYLRQLTDEVLNGVDWAGVDIKDAAARAGIDPSLPHEAILAMFKAAWGDSSLFANAANLDLINQQAVQAGIDKSNAQAAGKANIMALFGIAPDEATAQAIQLGTSLHTGIQQGITAGNAGGTGLGTSLVSGMANDITPETMAPVASAIAGGLTTGLDGEDVGFGKALEGVINKQLEGEGLFSGTAGMILEKIAGYFTDKEFGVDLIGSFSSIMVNQLGVQTAIDHLLDVGSRIAEIVFKGFQAKSEELDWTGAVNAAALGGPTAAAVAVPGNASGTNFWQGGLTWVGEQGEELVRLPRGSEIMSNQRSRFADDRADREVTVVNNNFYNTITNQIDINKLAYQVAAIQSRRR